MATLTITLTQRLALTGSSIDSIFINVKNGANNVTDLVAGDFAITSDATLTTPPTINVDDKANGNYVINFVTKPTTANYVVITITKDPNSGRLFIDPSSTFSATGESTITGFTVPKAGQYKFVLGQVNEENPIDKVSASTYNFVYPADATNSSIAISNKNPNQAIVIPEADRATGVAVSLLVTLKDSQSPAQPISGDNSVTIFLQKQ